MKKRKRARRDPNVEYRGAFRAPDDYVLGPDSWALWWGPTKSKRQAEAFTEVEEDWNGFSVTEYTFVGGYEGFKKNEWTTQTTRVEMDELVRHLREEPRSNRPPTRVFHPKTKDDKLLLLRVAAGYGVGKIGYYGGEEEILSTREVRERLR